MIRIGLPGKPWGCAAGGSASAAMATTNANFPTADRTMPRCSTENISGFQSSKEQPQCRQLMACRSALAALPICRNRKLKGHPGADPGRSPHPSAVCFDDRAADRESHSQAVRLGRVEGAEKSVCVLRLDTDTDVLDRHQHPIGLMWLRAHDEHAIAVADRRHSLHPIDS